MDRQALFSKIAGSLMAGALGDALGYEVEFQSWPTIRENYGPGGIRQLALENGKARISDDTQMTLFTNEGLILGYHHAAAEGIALDAAHALYPAYLCWLKTQFDHALTSAWAAESELMRVPGLFAARAPGNTCLAALESGNMGTVEQPINHSKGCGGVMRAAPVGYPAAGVDPLKDGAACAAITHGHPGGWAPAAMLADLVHRILYGPAADLEQQVQQSLTAVQAAWHGEAIDDFAFLVREAILLSHSSVPDVEAIHSLGGGWVGDEALAIALFSCLKHPDSIPDALISAVNHSGDSDSTGAIAGNILGAKLGLDALPQQWIDQLELTDTILREAECMTDLAMGQLAPAASREVDAARALAQARHQGQLDKAGLPYISHPQRVAERMTAPEEQVVAWLHDTVEDTGLTIPEIEARFGPVTAAAVDAISRRDGEAWEDYLDRVRANPLARQVKISDLIDNSNLSRLEHITMKDVLRQAKYNQALQYLMSSSFVAF